MEHCEDCLLGVTGGDITPLLYCGFISSLVDIERDVGFLCVLVILSSCQRPGSQHQDDFREERERTQVGRSMEFMSRSSSWATSHSRTRQRELSGRFANQVWCLWRSWRLEAARADERRQPIKMLKHVGADPNHDCESRGCRVLVPIVCRE